MRARTTHVCSNVGGLRAWLTDWCSNMDAGKSESKICPLEQQTGERQSQAKLRERESENRERETINKLQKMLLSYLCSRPSNAGHSLLACVCLSCVAVVVRGNCIVFKVNLCIGMVFEMVPGSGSGVLRDDVNMNMKN